MEILKRINPVYSSALPQRGAGGSLHDDYSVPHRNSLGVLKLSCYSLPGLRALPVFAREDGRGCPQGRTAP